MRLQADERARRRFDEQRVVARLDDFDARIRRIVPLGHPLQAHARIDAVKIRQAGEQPVGMLTDVHAQRSRPELDDGGGERGVPESARAFAGELTKSAVDNGKSGRLVSHGRGRRGQQFGKPSATKIFHARDRRDEVCVEPKPAPSGL